MGTRERSELVTPPGAELLELLGHGAFAVVHRARIPGRQGTVVLRTFTGQTEAPCAYQERMRRRFRRGLQHHREVSELEGVVTMLDVLDDEQRPSAMLEFVQGTTIRRIDGTFTEKLRVIRQLAETLRNLHDRGVVHRDIKPDNVIVTPAKLPVLIDFDLASRREGPQPTTWDPTETPILPGSNYHHPEFREAFDRTQADSRFNGHNIRQPAVDVYGLGGLLLLVLTGEDPHANVESTERAVARASHGALVDELGAKSANVLLGLALQCLSARLRDIPSIDDVITTLDGVLAVTAMTTVQTAMFDFVLGAALRNATDLQRHYSKSVLRTLRVRRIAKLASCALAFVGPALVWKLTGAPPVIQLSLVLVANLVFILTAGQLSAIADAVTGAGGRRTQRVVSPLTRLLHHANRLAWIISFVVFVSSLAAIPWQLAHGEPTTSSPSAGGLNVPRSAGAARHDSDAPASTETPVTIPASVAVDAPFPDGMTLALWNRGKEGRFVTTFFETSDGRSTSSCDALVIGTPISTWEVVLQKKKLVVRSPIHMDEVEKYPGLTFHPTRTEEADTMAFYVRGFHDPGSTKLVIPPPPAVDEGLLAWGHSYKPLGGYGPFLFVQESLYQYGGGASGFDTHRFHVLNLGAPESSVAMYSGDAFGGGVERSESFLTSDEFTQLRLLGSALSNPTSNEKGVGQLVTYYPTYDNGELRWMAQFAWDASRGASDGHWDTYTRSRFSLAPDLAPTALRDVKPPQISNLSSAVLTFAGWSWVRTADLQDFERRQDCRRH